MFLKEIFSKLLTYLLNMVMVTSHLTIKDIMDMACVNDKQCGVFRSDTYNVTCLDGYCKCFDSISHQSVLCQPEKNNIHNIIAGPCPCSLQHTECHAKEQICYCEVDYIPSLDRRRCILKKVALGDLCETDFQCSSGNIFSKCDTTLKKCVCQENFVSLDGDCVSILDKKCQSREDCLVIGDNVKCHSEVNKCFCSSGEIASLNKMNCTKGTLYNEPCVTLQLCQISLGPGGLCLKNRCVCAKNFILGGENITNKCSKKIILGDYCKFDVDCQEFAGMAEKCPMECCMGECRCRNECTRGRGMTVALHAVLRLFIIIQCLFKMCN